MSRPKIHLLTFAAGPDFRGSLTALRQEAARVSLFDELHVWDESILTSDAAFWEQHGEFISSHPRGWGYWLWKPYIVLKLLAQLADDDIVVYMDGGCQLNVTPDSVARLADYVRAARESPHGMISFSLRYFTESRFTKMDTAHALRATDTLYMDSKQLVGGIFVARKCNHTTNLFRECYAACCADNYHLIDDTPSILPNAADFQEHRHDQSVFSLLRKKRGTEVVEDETYWGPPFFAWDPHGANFPIWARRRRISIS